MKSASDAVTATSALSSVSSSQASSAKRLYIRDGDYGWLPAVPLGERDRHHRIKVKVTLPKDWTETTVQVNASTENDQQDSKPLQKKKIWVSKHDVLVCSESPSSSLRDVIMLDPLNEASCLYLLKKRYVHRKYYTRMGSVMIAMNPFQPVDLSSSPLYSPELQRDYAKSFVWKVDKNCSNDTDEENLELDNDPSNTFVRNHFLSTSSYYSQLYNRLGLEPHVYELSATAYRGLLLEENTRQCILVSGLSGSGKTETIKLLIEHLVTMDTLSTTDALFATTPKQSKLRQAVLEHVKNSSSILEMFGNASTPLNRNSTRFGKIVKLFFALQNNGLYGFVGSQVETCLLETNRVVDNRGVVKGAGASGHNFHIFYHLLALPSGTKSAVLGPEWSEATPSDFVYLQHHQLDYADAFDIFYDADKATRLMEILETFQNDSFDLQHLLRALGTVLRLGNLTFTESLKAEALIKERDDLEKLSHSMGIHSTILERYLTTTTQRVNGEVISTPMNAAAARAACDMLAKTIYSCVFESIVRAINTHTSSALRPGNNYGVVSMIDIFGFETLDVNRFEQLCVNYTNEKLQLNYLTGFLRGFTAEYQQEGIELFDETGFDTTDILEFLEGSGGLFDCLVDESQQSNASNEAFVSKVKHATGGYGIVVEERQEYPTNFTIAHFVGPIVYDASNFVQRNGENISIDLLHLGAKSSNSLIAAEFCELVRAHEPRSPGPAKQTSDLTVIDMVLASAGKLMDATKSNISRELLPPSPTKQTMGLTMIEKVRASAEKLLDAAKDTTVQHIWCIKPNDIKVPCMVDHCATLRQLRCADLSTAISFSQEAFSNELSFKDITERFSCLITQKQKRDMQHMEPDERAQYLMSTLVAQLATNTTASTFAMPFACGRSKVYIRSSALAQLEEQRRNILGSKVSVIQNFARRTESLKRRRRMINSIVLVQSLVRRISGRSKFQCCRAAAIKLQAIARSSIQRSNFQRKLRALAILRRALAAFVKAERRRKKVKSATRIAAWYRSRVDLCVYKWIRRCLTTVQARARRRVIQREYEKILQAAAILSRVIRVFVEVKKRQRKVKAATVISKFYRSWKARSEFKAARAAIILIQAKRRSHLARVIFKKRHDAAKAISRFGCRILSLKRRREEEKAATAICAWYRSHLLTRIYRKFLWSIIMIQAALRGFKGRVEYRERIRAAWLIKYACSLFWNARCQVKAQEKRERAASVISAWYRGKSSLRQFLRARNAAITAQSAVRGYIYLKWFKKQIVYYRRFMKIINSGTFIVAWYRSRICRRKYCATRDSIIHLQAVWRAKRFRDEYLIMKGAALCLENWFQKCVIPQIRWHQELVQQQRQELALQQQQHACTIIQAWTRARYAKSKFECIKAAILVIQARFQLRRHNSLRRIKLLSLGQEKSDNFDITPQCQVSQSQRGHDSSSDYCDSSIEAWSCDHDSMRSSHLQTSVEEGMLVECLRREIDQYKQQMANLQAEIDASKADRESQESSRKNRFVNVEQDLVLEGLMREINEYKQQVATLQSEVQQITEFSSLHTQEIEADFEEKLSVYEEEVLNLKLEIAKAEQEKEELKKNMSEAEEAHQKNLRIIQKGVQKSQAQHRDYLDKIMSLLEDTEVARKTETDRIKEELETMKRERDAKIAALKEEIQLLRSIGFGQNNGSVSPGSLTEGAKKLARKLHTALSSENILLVVKEAQQHSEGAKKYIDAKLSSPALRKVTYLEEMVQIAAAEAAEQAKIAGGAKGQLQEIEKQLIRAYKEYGRLQHTTMGF